MKNLSLHKNIFDMKKLLKTIFAFIKRVYNSLVDETKKLVPVAINIVEGVKAFTDSNVDDVLLFLIETALPGLPEDKIAYYKLKLEKSLPKILLELNLVNDIANITDPNEQLKTILNTLKLSSDDIKNEKYHILGVKVLDVLADGKVTWGEAVILVEWYYQTYVKENG